MYITDPKTSLMPFFDNLKEQLKENGLTGLSDANSRYTYYEAIREVDDPIELRQQGSSRTLTSSDYLIEAPMQNRFLLSQSRLLTLKEKIEQFSKERERMNDLAEENARFTAGLLGN